jgi:hypothetical protein
MKPSKKDIMAKQLKNVKKWPRKQGKALLMKYLRGGRLTPKEAILAKCYECTQGEDTEPCGSPICPHNDHCQWNDSNEPDKPTQPDLFLGP